MTSIAQLMLLFAAVTALAAWIAMGSERTAYAGLQMAFAFYIAVLHGFDPSTDVTEVRDRLVGIVFGVVVMALVFSYVWPERAGTGMVQSLATALRRMSELATGAGDSGGVRAAAWQALAQADRLAELFAFEPEALAVTRRRTGPAGATSYRPHAARPAGAGSARAASRDRRACPGRRSRGRCAGCTRAGGRRSARRRREADRDGRCGRGAG